MKYLISSKKFWQKFMVFGKLLHLFDIKIVFFVTEFLYIKLITICRCLTWPSNLDPPIFNQTKVSWRKQIRYSIFLSSWIFGRIKNRHFKSTCRSWWQYMHRFQSRQWIIKRFVIILSLLCHQKLCHHLSSKKSRFESNIFLTKVAIRTNKIPSTKPVRARFPIGWEHFRKFAKFWKFYFPAFPNWIWSQHLFN